MTKYARVINGQAVDVRTESPEGSFTPEIAAQFVAVPAQVENGWVLKGEVWEAPVTPEPPEPVTPEPEYKKVSPIEFKLLFTPQERVSIKAARATDPVIDDFYDIVEDPRLTVVDLALQSTKDAIGYLEAQGLIAAGRKDEILTGVVQ